MLVETRGTEDAREVLAAALAELLACARSGGAVRPDFLAQLRRDAVRLGRVAEVDAALQEALTERKWQQGQGALPISPRAGSR